MDVTCNLFSSRLHRVIFLSQGTLVPLHTGSSLPAPIITIALSSLETSMDSYIVSFRLTFHSDPYRLASMDPLLLPCEVIERIIGHSGDHPQTLHNFSLTCRNLRPRALCLMVADVRFKNRAKIFNFCDFLQAKPHLKPLVRSIAIHPNDFPPIPVLNILPNLFELQFGTLIQRVPGQKTLFTILNQSTLTGCKYLGTNIRVLRLSDLSFLTCLDFARILLAFPNLTDLACSDIIIEEEGDRAPLDVLKRRLSEQLRLRTVSPIFLLARGSCG